MKTSVLLLALAIAIFTPAQTHKNRPSQDNGTAEKTLIDLENKWVDALVNGDAATLDGIFAESYVDTDEHNHRGTKQELLAALKSPDLKIASIKLSDMQVHLYGDAAVVTGSAEQTGSFQGQALTVKIIFTDTFVRKNGRWVAVASHRSVA